MLRACFLLPAQAELRSAAVTEDGIGYTLLPRLRVSASCCLTQMLPASCAGGAAGGGRDGGWHGVHGAASAVPPGTAVPGGAAHGHSAPGRGLAGDLEQILCFARVLAVMQCPQGRRLPLHPSGAQGLLAAPFKR